MHNDESQENSLCYCFECTRNLRNIESHCSLHSTAGWLWAKVGKPRAGIHQLNLTPQNHTKATLFPVNSKQIAKADQDDDGPVKVVEK